MAGMWVQTGDLDNAKSPAAMLHGTQLGRHIFFFFFFAHFYFPASGQAVVTGVVPSSPRFLPKFNLYRAYGFSNPTAR